MTLTTRLAHLAAAMGLEVKRAPTLSTVDPARGGWWPLISEWRTGAWQANEAPVSLDTALAYFATYACVTLIAQDISKMRLRLMNKTASGVWVEKKNPAYSPVLRKPNHFQNRVRYTEWWIMSKLIHGNTYALKQRDARGVVRAEYVLDPFKVTPLVSESGDVFYELKRDPLEQVAAQDPITVPAREMMHDLMCPIFHPLVGVSPLFAAGVSAMQGANIQANSTRFFANMSMPGGVLTAPGHIPDDVALRAKADWETNFGGSNYGRVAVLGDGLKFETMAIPPEHAQLIEQLKFSAEMVCSVHHVPPYMIGIGPAPTYNNIEALNQQYYAQALQNLIESFEIVHDEGLELDTEQWGTEFDLDDLLRMDTATKMKVAGDGVNAAIFKINEARAKFSLEPVDGGDTPYLQQQYWPLAQLAEREIPAVPAGPTAAGGPTPTPAPTPTTPPEDMADSAVAADEARDFLARLTGNMAALATKHATVTHAD